MSEKPMLSVIVPVYNVEKTLERCLDSIKEQTYSKYEVILIDDGSIDRSGKICDIYANEDIRFKVIHSRNRGVSSARNIGLEHGSGKYVMFVDSDDYILSDMFEKFVTVAEKGDADIVIGGAHVHKKKDILISKLPPIYGTIGNVIWNFICMDPDIYGYVWGKLFKSNVIKNNSIKFSVNMYAQEDLDFNLSVYEKSINFETIDYVGYEYEYTPGKRKPPVWDFISNSLKMYRIALQKTNLSIEAKNAIKDRIVSQIFSLLYNCNNIDEYEFAIGKLKSVEGLQEYLNSQKITGESKFVINWLLDEKYEWIYKYFSMRKMLKRILGRPVSE